MPRTWILRSRDNRTEFECLSDQAVGEDSTLYSIKLLYIHMGGLYFSCNYVFPPEAEILNDDILLGLVFLNVQFSSEISIYIYLLVPMLFLMTNRTQSFHPASQSAVRRRGGVDLRIVMVVLGSKLCWLVYIIP
ncbi:hypothetical protein METBIDRAFT_98980 [Metschnikowia bicuspidata var. bicuspidata NRRL YB-4993]|uniref:Uncharacterized protein n=1 Tax=Metschnikowia bicuspidata var. bicuspidata NRRL YB-4993 TaxID=869754 RepID=A0A1A0HG13_9ASCO|nr:hypothetical protein METBIDRAFT_98980 [Metschnikowia bicuspidata var. bicuspidata NRRL YB-4993]OBA23099.1 hypothetical protein METBIDRAFT_98980 [Metschnikowia bicuspidata var. bicuspidata NRRL YB-4993]